MTFSDVDCNCRCRIDSFLIILFNSQDHFYIIHYISLYFSVSNIPVWVTLTGLGILSTIYTTIVSTEHLTYLYTLAASGPGVVVYLGREKTSTAPVFSFCFVVFRTGRVQGGDLVRCLSMRCDTWWSGYDCCFGIDQNWWLH